MGATRIRVLCVDDHRLVRDGISLIIQAAHDMGVIGAAATGEEAVELYDQLRPDVTLMDLRLKSMNGVEATRIIRRRDPNARIIILTTYQGDEDIFRALEAGAATYLLKDTLSDDLIRVVREIHAGRFPAVSPDVHDRLSERREWKALTARETQVLELIFKGFRNKEVAASLGISEHTVRIHVKQILAKLKVKDRTAAINVALRRGILHVE